MNRLRFGRREGSQELLPPLPDAGSAEHDQQGVRSRLDRRRLDLARSCSPRPQVPPPPSERPPAPAPPCPGLPGRRRAPPGRASTGSGPRSGAGTVQGSRQVGPANTPKAARRSATRRASGPCTPVSCIPIGRVFRLDASLAWGIRPSVGFSAAMPQHWAGWRSDPSPSLPSPNGLMPVAIAAASPALEAPGVRVRSHGLIVAPHSSLSVCQRISAAGKVGATDRDRPGGLHPLDDRGVPTRIGLRQRLESLGGRRAGRRR